MSALPDRPCAGRTDLFYSPRESDIAEAKRICHDECQWRVACLTLAIRRTDVSSHGEDEGVWGGMDRIERRIYVRKLRQSQMRAARLEGNAVG